MKRRLEFSATCPLLPDLAWLKHASNAAADALDAAWVHELKRNFLS